MPHIIDKGIPTNGLLAQVPVAKFLDHLPLYRQERIFDARQSGYSVLDADAAGGLGGRECGEQLQPLAGALTVERLKRNLLHADGTPVSMLRPGNSNPSRLSVERKRPANPS